MRQETRQAVDAWWREVFGLGAELWRTVTVRHPHSPQLGDYGGWYVAWRGQGVHVSAPSSAEGAEVGSLADQAAVALQAVEFWTAFARQRGLEVIGPGVHRYLDEDPGPADGVLEVDRTSLHALRDRVSEDDWWESSFDEALEDPGTVAFATDGGGAVLTVLDGAPRNVGLLVAADARGRGVGTALGRAAASYAVRHHGYARWRSRDVNVASSRAAARLGFEPYVTQLAIRRGS